MSLDGSSSGIPCCRFSCFLSLIFLLALLSLSHAGDLLIGDSVDPTLNQPHFYPFDNGESTEYWATWSGIPVASAKIRLDPLFIEGEKFYQVKVRARSWKYLNFIWKMRDSIESIFEAETFRTRRFVFRQRENRRKVDTIASFDRKSNKWVVERQKRNKVKRFEFVSRKTFDPISAVYLVRSLDFKAGDTIKMEVFGGKSRYLVTMDVVGRERIATDAGVFDAYKIVPKVINLSRSGYARRMRQAAVWISSDEKRMLLKIVSRVFIGSVTIELVERKVTE